MSVLGFDKNLFIPSSETKLVEGYLDKLTALTASLCDTKICLLILAGTERNWVKSSSGGEELSGQDIQSLCEIFTTFTSYVEMPDLLAQNNGLKPLLKSGIRFYASVVLRGLGGDPMGVLCIIDSLPRNLTELQREALNMNARAASQHLELTRLLVHPRNKKELNSKAKASRQIDVFWAHFKTLTAREKQVMEMIIENSGNLSNKEIARKFDISYRTVEIHRSKIMSKMKVKSIAELIAISLKSEY